MSLLHMGGDEQARWQVDTVITRASPLEVNIAKEGFLHLNFPVMLVCTLTMVCVVAAAETADGKLSQSVKLAVVVCFLMTQVLFSIAMSLGVAYRMTRHTSNLRLIFGAYLAHATLFAAIYFGNNYNNNKKLWTRHTSNLRLIFGAYLAHATLFAAIYFGLVVLDSSALQFTESPVLESKDSFFALFVSTLYFSLATMTHTAFGDISPHSTLAAIVCTLQVLLGVAYNVVVFAIALSMFLAMKDLKQRTLRAPSSDKYGFRRCQRRVRRHCPCVAALQTFLIKYLFPVLLVWQIVSVLALVLVTDATGSEHNSLAILTYGILQLCALALMMVASIRIAGRIFAQQTVSVRFLAQSYLGSVLMFAGMYCLVMIASQTPSDAWHGLLIQEDESSRALQIGKGFLQLLYFSLATMSTCGYGDIVPITTAGKLTCCLQMVAAQMYIVQIMGSGGAAVLSQLPSVHRLKLQSSDSGFSCFSSQLSDSSGYLGVGGLWTAGDPLLPSNGVNSPPGTLRESNSAAQIIISQAGSEIGEESDEPEEYDALPADLSLTQINL
eukprot:g81342.t1